MIGFLINHGNNKEMINCINQLSGKVNCIVFSGSAIPALNTNVLQKFEAFHFNGNIITDDLSLAQQMKNLGYCKNRYLYLSNLKWYTINPLHLTQLENTIFPKNIDIIANTPQDAEIIEHCFNKKPKHIMNGWNVNVLEQIANE